MELKALKILKLNSLVIFEASFLNDKINILSSGLNSTVIIIISVSSVVVLLLVIFIVVKCLMFDKINLNLSEKGEGQVVVEEIKKHVPEIINDQEKSNITNNVSNVAIFNSKDNLFTVKNNNKLKIINDPIDEEKKSKEIEEKHSEFEVNFRHNINIIDTEKEKDLYHLYNKQHKVIFPDELYKKEIMANNDDNNSKDCNSNIVNEIYQFTNEQKNECYESREQIANLENNELIINPELDHGNYLKGEGNNKRNEVATAFRWIDDNYPRKLKFMIDKEFNDKILKKEVEIVENIKINNINNDKEKLRKMTRSNIGDLIQQKNGENRK